MTRADLIRLWADKKTTQPVKVIATHVNEGLVRITFVGDNGWVSHKNLAPGDVVGIEFDEVRNIQEDRHATVDESKADEGHVGGGVGFSEGSESPTPEGSDSDQA